MFQHQNIWLPDGEKHFPVWMDKNGEIVEGRGTYQIEKWRACIPWIKQWRTAVDVGAHVGLWTMHMAKVFENVVAFEPVAQFRECLTRNVATEIHLPGMMSKTAFEPLPNVVVIDQALGARRGRVEMITPTLHGGLDTGGTHVNQAAESGDVELHTLDSFGLQDVDFLKIDCEGYEHHVVEGARETLARWKPCVIVEQKPHKLGPNFGITGTPAVDLLKELGAKGRVVMSGDYIMSWD